MTIMRPLGKATVPANIAPRFMGLPIRQALRAVLSEEGACPGWEDLLLGLVTVIKCAVVCWHPATFIAAIPASMAPWRVCFLRIRPPALSIVLLNGSA